jgi:hypothetical protein
MMKTYSHVRRQALDAAAAVLEPTFEFNPPSSVKPELQTEAAVQPAAETVTSQVTSQSDELDVEFREIVKKFGSPHWTIFDPGSFGKPRKRRIQSGDLDLGCLRSATFAPNQRDSSAQSTMAIETAQRHDVPGYSVRIVTPAPNTAVCCRVYAGAVGSVPAQPDRTWPDR